MRKQAQPALFLGLLFAAVLTAAAVAMRSGRVSLALPATTPAWLVIVTAVAAALAALAVARLVNIVPRLRAALPARRVPTELFDDLADLADLARVHGLLVLAADPRARQYPLMLAGLHLLCEDADRRLVRSALEGQAETCANRTASSRGAAIFACRAAMAVASIAVAAALVWAAFNAAAPWHMAAPQAVLMAGAVGLFAVTTAVAAPSVLVLRRITAAEELSSAAVIETILAIHAHEDRASTRKRLESLNPAGQAEGAAMILAARQAA